MRRARFLSTINFEGVTSVIGICRFSISGAKVSKSSKVSFFFFIMTYDLRPHPHLHALLQSPTQIFPGGAIILLVRINTGSCSISNSIERSVARQWGSFACTFFDNKCRTFDSFTHLGAVN